MNRIIIAFTLTILISGLVYGCNSKNHIPQRMNLKLLSLTKDLSISAESQEVLIGDFSGLAVDEKGVIYAADSRLQKIHLFSPDGDYLDSLGRRGEGPGEFTRLDPNIRIRLDTLYVKDNNAKRINLFNLKTLQSFGTINIPNAKIEGVPMGYLRDMFPLSNGNLMVSFMNTYFTAPQEEDITHKTTVSLINTSGEFIKQNILQLPVLFPTDQRLIYLESNHGSRSMTVFTDLSFYPDTKMAISPAEQLYIGNTDSLILRRYDKDGELAGILQGTYQPAPLKDSDIDSISKGKRNTFEKAIDEIDHPDHWPAFRDFLFDDKSHCWIQLISPGKSQQTWWVFNRDGKPKWKFKLPTEIKLYTVKNGEAYGIFQPHEDIPSIVRYQINKSEER